MRKKEELILKQIYLEILKVDIKNNFLIVITDNSLIVGVSILQKYSEAPVNNGDNYRFDFNNLNACLIYVNNSVAVIGFGKNEIMGYFITEYCYPNLISARLFTMLGKLLN